MSNETLVTASQVTGSSPVSTTRSIAARKAVRLRWSTTTPFGLPVEPEVWMT